MSLFTILKPVPSLSAHAHAHTHSETIRGARVSAVVGETSTDLRPGVVAARQAPPSRAPTREYSLHHLAHRSRQPKNS